MSEALSSTVASTLSSLNAPGDRPSSNQLNTLGQGDFLRLLTVQLQQQDPLEPVDNQQMLAQMAQFSGLAGTTETNATLEQIAIKIDALVEAQEQSLAAQQATLAAAQQAALAASAAADSTPGTTI